jgi:hypothetical protein
MTSRLFTAAVAALSLITAVAPAMDAMAQGHHSGGGGHSAGGGGGGRGGGGGSGGGGRGGGGGGGYHGGGGGGYRGGGYRGGGGYGAGALIGGLALGTALGYYAGRPYYCRGHHHWRWSPYYHRYVYYNGGYC